MYAFANEPPSLPLPTSIGIVGLVPGANSPAYVTANLGSGSGCRSTFRLPDGVLLPVGESQAGNSSTTIVSIHNTFRHFNILVTNFLFFGGDNRGAHSTVIGRYHSGALLGIVSAFMAFRAESYYITSSGRLQHARAHGLCVQARFWYG